MTPAVKRFWSSWADPTKAKPTIVNVFYVDHTNHQVWFNYEPYMFVRCLSNYATGLTHGIHRKKVGNEQYLWHGAPRVCNIGDDNSQVTACHQPKCYMCSILRATVDPAKASL